MKTFKMLIRSEGGATFRTTWQAENAKDAAREACEYHEPGCSMTKVLTIEEA